jgi:signal peptidase II
MQFLFFSLFAALIVVADQITKYLTVALIPLYSRVDFIPGLLSFTYVQNTGAAWSMFEGMQWMFALIFLVLTAAVLYEYFKSPLPFSTFERWCIAAIYGGGLGNMIDRVRLGYVIDMIKTDFMVFPVFNVADCFITCGCFAMIFSLLFINKAFWKDDKK